ncbi:MAG: DNA-binding protein [Candidatus Diapherotrites archaeon]|nr:DNA-binding protein [Candidatus Diapherotrites archaeon]
MDEELRQRKLQELREKQLAQAQEKARQESQTEMMLRQILDESAKTRLSNVKLVNPELYTRAVNALLYLANSGKLQQKLGEEHVRQVLSQLNPKKEIKITRK